MRYVLLAAFVLSGCSSEDLANFAELVGDDSTAHLIRLEDNAEHVSAALGTSFTNIGSVSISPVVPGAVTGTADFKGIIEIPTENPDNTLGTMSLSIDFDNRTVTGEADNFSSYSTASGNLKDAKITEVYSGKLKVSQGQIGAVNNVSTVLGNFDGTITGPKSGAHRFDTDINGAVGQIDANGKLTVGGGLVGEYRVDGKRVPLPAINTTDNYFIVTQ